MSDNPTGASYVYLLEPEIRFLEAAVEHLIPTDELGPGARDAGVVVYIDRQLAGELGNPRMRMYRGGLWQGGARRSRATNRALRRREVYPHRDLPKSTSIAEDRVRPSRSRSFPVTGN